MTYTEYFLLTFISLYTRRSPYWIQHLEFGYSVFRSLISYSKKSRDTKLYQEISSRNKFVSEWVKNILIQKRSLLDLISGKGWARNSSLKYKDRIYNSNIFSTSMNYQKKKQKKRQNHKKFRAWTKKWRFWKKKLSYLCNTIYLKQLFYERIYLNWDGFQ